MDAENMVLERPSTALPDLGSSRFFGNRRQNSKTTRNLYAGFNYLQ